MREVPVGGECRSRHAFAGLIPVGADAQQHVVQFASVDETGARSKTAVGVPGVFQVFGLHALGLLDRNAGQAVVGEHQPRHRFGQWRQVGEWQMLGGMGLIQPVAQ